ncbi:MAG: Glycerate 2-kinase [Candidatus Hydrogenedentota bacterium]|jgi:glycerate kinase
MRVLIAPDSFKEACTAEEAAGALARGWHAVRPQDELRLLPLADGGEGTMNALSRAWHCESHVYTVSGPLGQPVEAALGFNPDTRVAVIEMAAASGLALIPQGSRNPFAASTRGTGELLLHALKLGARRVVVGAGGSATNDGGAGAGAALGFHLLDVDGNPLPPGGAALSRLSRIDASGRTPLLRGVLIEVACDVTNPLCGAEGASMVYGPQKGATPAECALLDEALLHFAEIMERDLGARVRDIPGSGAAGGLAAGLMSFANATLRSGISLVAEALKLPEAIAAADLVLTGEGRLDGQSAQGKTVGGLLDRANRAGVPVVAFAGQLGQGHEQLFMRGIRHAECISAKELDATTAIRDTLVNLEAAARRVARDFRLD